MHCIITVLLTLHRANLLQWYLFLKSYNYTEFTWNPSGISIGNLVLEIHAMVVWKTEKQAALTYFIISVLLLLTKNNPENKLMFFFTSWGKEVLSMIKICSTSSTPQMAIHDKMEGIYLYSILYLMPCIVWNGWSSKLI